MRHEETCIGNIEVITGPMFAGKSEELLRRINRLKYAKKKFLVFDHLFHKFRVLDIEPFHDDHHI